MRTPPERYIGHCLLLLLLSAVAPPAADWVRTKARLPPGYGAEGDRRRANPVPALVRPAVEALSAGADGNWVEECVEDGAWAYELHLFRGGVSSVIQLNSNGRVIQPEAPEPEPIQETAPGGL